MSRVFSILNRDHNYRVTDATRFGRLVYLLDGSALNPFSVESYCEAIALDLQENQYHPDKDLIMLTGSPVAVSLLTAVIMAKYRRGRLLLFDPKTGKYCERALILQEVA